MLWHNVFGSCIPKHQVAKRDGLFVTKQIMQPCWIFTPTEGVLVDALNPGEDEILHARLNSVV